MDAETHIVGMESLVLVRAGGAARAWRGRGAAPRPPAREYHRRARMPACACGPRALPCAPRSFVENREISRRARTRVFINGIPHALFAAGYNFLHDFQHLRRTEH